MQYLLPQQMSPNTRLIAEVARTPKASGTSSLLPTPQMFIAIPSDSLSWNAWIKGKRRTQCVQILSVCHPGTASFFEKCHFPAGSRLFQVTIFTETYFFHPYYRMCNLEENYSAGPRITRFASQVFFILLFLNAPLVVYLFVVPEPGK